MRALVGFFARRTLLVNMILAMAIIGGIIVLQNQEYSAYPPMDLGEFTINTYKPGASAEDVELSITVPLEDEIMSVDGLEKVTSTSVEGFSSLLVHADPGNNPAQNVAFSTKLREAVDRATARLPDDLPFKPNVIRHDPDLLPVVELLIHGEVSEDVLRKTSRLLRNEILQLPDIAGVEIAGYRQRELKILVDPQRLHQLSLGHDEIIAAISSRNVRDSGGSLTSYYSEQDVVTVGEFNDPREVEEVIIRSNGPGNYLRVRDVAKVVMGYEDWTTQSLSDGKPGIGLRVKKVARSNGLNVSRQMHQYVEQVNTRLPIGVKVTAFNDTSRRTQAMLDSLLSNAAAGIVLVFLILMAFFPFRFTFWVALGIPVAILIALTLMPMFGMGINQVSLAAFILMLGILVDDAIVVSESIFQHREKGESPIDAAINGTMSIAAPVLTSSATTLLAFAPLLFLAGNEGKFMWVVPAMVIMVLSASLFECKFMLPAHMASAFRRHADHPEKDIRSWWLPVDHYYRRYLHKIVEHRYLSLIGFTVFMVLVGYVGVQYTNVNLYPDEDVDHLMVKVELPVGTSFATTREVMSEMDQDMRALLTEQDLLSIKYTVGHHRSDAKGELTAGKQPSWAIMDIFLHPSDYRKTESQILLASVREYLAQRSDFIRKSVEPYRDTPPTGRSVEVHFVGNTDERYQAADVVVRFLDNHPGVTESWTTYSPGKDIVELVLNHQAIADYGLTVATITKAVRIAFDGLLIDELQTIDERIKFRLQFQQQEQGKLDTLYGLSIFNQQGQPVLLRNVAEFITRPGESSVRHYFGDRALSVYAEIDKKKVSVAEINRELSEYIEKHQLAQQYPELSVLQSGEVERQQEAMGSVSSAAAMAVLGIMFLLVLLFNSITQPLLVMAVIPLGIIGVFFVFAVHGLDISMSALVGLVGLAGILVNDSLILIDCLNKSRGDKKTLSLEEIVKGSASRLRPIYITTFTTIGGLLPAAYGLLGQNTFLQPMIMAMFWGVLFGSFVTLFYLPCLYAVEQDFRVRFWAFVRRERVTA